MEEQKLTLGGYEFTGDPYQEDWTQEAACHDSGNLLFVRGAAQNKVKRGCGGCAVQAACLRTSFAEESKYGIWGGLSERQRRKLVKELGGYAEALAVIDHDRDVAVAQQIEQNTHPEEYAVVSVPLRLVPSHTRELDFDAQQQRSA